MILANDKEMARIAWHKKARPSGNQFDGVFLDGYDAGQQTMREQIEGLITEICKERQECIDIMTGHPELTYANHEFLLGKRVSLDWAFYRLKAILARHLPENGSERLETPNTGTFDEGYDAGFQAALKEMRNV